MAARSIKRTTKSKSEDIVAPSEQLVPKKMNNSAQITERKRAVAFQKVQEILMQNVSKSGNKTFTQYTKSLIKSYLQNPYSYRDSIREVSRYLYRVSTLYKKIILYYATMPLYYYNATYEIDFSKGMTRDKLLKEYQSHLKRLQCTDFQKESIPIIATTIRDGSYCGFVYDNEENGLFIHMLDPQYYKIRGKNSAGQWVVYFDASYFSSGNNKEFVEGVDGDTNGTWDQVFVDGWKDYQNDSMNARWFALPPEKTICLVANMDDEFDMPLPFFTGIFTSLLDCLDFEQIIADKTALENYCLLVSSIPLIKNSDAVDDFAISWELIEEAQEQIKAAVPDLCATAVLPGMELKPIFFTQSNTIEDTDTLSKSIENVFNQSGASQLVVAGGSSTNSVGLKQAIANDTALTFMWLGRLESNFQYYYRTNVSDKWYFSFHRITWYNQDDYLAKVKESATLGNDKMDYLTALGSTPYQAFCKLFNENILDISSIMVPLKSSYTDSSNDGGAPEKDDSELTEEGIATRDGGKNEGTKASK